MSTAAPVSGPHCRLIAGAMSGTSADGVDVAITRVEGRGLEMTAGLVRHHHRPYPRELRSEIFAFRGASAPVDLSRLARLGHAISLTYAAAVNEALLAEGMTGGDLACVAAHGQTLYHDPPLTIQWFDPSLVAAEVGCPVVSDFRRADCAAGGQGAPLVPFADYILFRHPTKNRVLLNIGGIANITYLPAGGSLEDVIAFDTGPGNCISDWLCRTHEPEGPGYDVGGERADRGNVREDVLHRCHQNGYFYRLPPKSTDSPAMTLVFEQALRQIPQAQDVDDLLATAARLTVDEAMSQVFAFVEVLFHEVIVAGGGTRNARMMRELGRWAAEDVESYEVLTTDAFGIPTDARESIAFALLGAATLDGVPSNVPSVTGARRAVVLGSVTPRP